MNYHIYILVGDKMKILIINKRIFITINIIIFILIMISIYSLDNSVQPYVTTQADIYNQNNNLEGFNNKLNQIMQSEEKVAYLTFDDGPTASVTNKILDILLEENIKATFFVIGSKVDEKPEIVKRAYEEGHYIANHGYSHNNAVLYKNKESFIREIMKTEESIRKAIQKEDYCSYVFRFPNGFMSPTYKREKNEATKILSEMNYAYIDWNCLNNDSMRKYTPSQLFNNLKESCKGKKALVILMHDTKDVSDSSLALKDSIKYLKNQGYTFKNLYQLLEEK